MRESWGRVRKWVQIIMMLTGPVVLAIALCNVTSEKLWQARAEEVQQIKKEKGLNGENSVRRAVALEKIQWEKAEKVYDGKREAVLTGYYQVQLEGSNVKTYTEAVIQKVIKQPQNYELAECEQKKISGIHMKVIPKNLYLQVEDHSVDYGVTMETLEADLRKHGKVFIKEGILQEDLRWETCKAFRRGCAGKLLYESGAGRRLWNTGGSSSEIGRGRRCDFSGA